MSMKRKSLCELTPGTWMHHVHPYVVAHRYNFMHSVAKLKDIILYDAKWTEEYFGSIVEEPKK